MSSKQCKTGQSPEGYLTVKQRAGQRLKDVYLDSYYALVDRLNIPFSLSYSWTVIYITQYLRDDYFSNDVRSFTNCMYHRCFQSVPPFCLTINSRMTRSIA